MSENLCHEDGHATGLFKEPYRKQVSRREEDQGGEVARLGTPALPALFSRQPAVWELVQQKLSVVPMVVDL